jgi:hypothetical protein
MSGMHPTEEILQQFAEDRAVCTPDEIAHIEGCPQCREAVAAYAVVIEELGGAAVPVFGFDLAETVVARVRAVEEGAGQVGAEAGVVAKRKAGAVPMLALIAVVVGSAGAFFWRSAYFVFTDMAANFYWIILVVAGLVVGLFIARLHRKYQQVINLINK